MSTSKYRWACHGCAKGGRLTSAAAAKKGGEKHAKACKVAGYHAAVILESAFGGRIGVIDHTSPLT